MKIRARLAAVMLATALVGATLAGATASTAGAAGSIPKNDPGIGRRGSARQSQL